MKRFYKILKILGIAILSLLIIITIAGFLISKDIPKGQQGPEADELAEEILEELNYEAFKTTKRISWTFAGIHSYDWYKNDNYVIVKSEDYKVKIDLDNYDKSEVLSSIDIEDDDLIKTCIKNFNNDSFWLIAPYKIMEENVERRLVKEDNDESLLVTYTSGGSTPGDSYLWKVDQNKRPTSFNMWVSIIPVGGLEAYWKDWVETESGMILSTRKTVFGVPVEITNLEVDF
ncbi:hypothetical protein [Psychroflexus montanilacus]|uniref:hypothetical protein n=1 Tax=Psychroflexus montanilacus TaxID=2873598 RepID=UPI001CCEB7F6|nr:hypothetical protein [Psychroflexus montanilacus]MBZ9650832.1 hypothetical protein [Psychroflexus montanilacus]